MLSWCKGSTFFALFLATLFIAFCRLSGVLDIVDESLTLESAGAGAELWFWVFKNLFLIYLSCDQTALLGLRSLSEKGDLRLYVAARSEKKTKFPKKRRNQRQESGQRDLYLPTNSHTNITSRFRLIFYMQEKS